MARCRIAQLTSYQRLDELPTPASSAPRVAVLSPWSIGDVEFTEAQRTVVAALTATCEIHLFTLGETGNVLSGLSFTRHVLDPRPTERATLHRDLIVSNYALPSGGTEYERASSLTWPTEGADAIVSDETDAAWRQARPLLDQIEPAAIIVLDHRDRGVLQALPELSSVPIVLIPLADTVSTPDRVHFDTLFTRIDHIVVFTEAERKKITSRTETPTTVIPLPVRWEADSASVPDDSGDAYVMVLTGSDRWDRLGRRVMVEFIAMANPQLRIVVVNDDSTEHFVRGIRRPMSHAVTEAELHRLISSATAVVDLHPGRLYARQSLLCLQAGTPLLVPRASRAREYCEMGCGGLWFDNGGELLWSLSALCDPAIGIPLGRQGQAYALAHHHSFERFADQLRQACGIREGADSTLT